MQITIRGKRMKAVQMCVLILMLIVSILTFTVVDSNAVTSNQIMGEYYLSVFVISYPVYGVTLTSNDAYPYSGKLSATTKGFVMQTEMNFPDFGFYLTRWGCGFYTVSGTQMNVSIIGQPSDYITVSYEDGFLISSGSAYDDYGDFFTYSYGWVKSAPYFTLSDVNFIVDQEVAEAEAVKNAIIAQKDQTISNLNATIVNMHTQEELNQAVADAVAEKDGIIALRDQTILDKETLIMNLIEFNSDGKLDLKDVIYALRTLSGIQ